MNDNDFESNLEKTRRLIGFLRELHERNQYIIDQRSIYMYKKIDENAFIEDLESEFDTAIWTKDFGYIYYHLITIDTIEKLDYYIKHHVKFIHSLYKNVIRRNIRMKMRIKKLRILHKHMLSGK